MERVNIELGVDAMPDGTPLKNISEYSSADVLCGRGGSNYHAGNNHWRALVVANKRLYISLPRKRKCIVAKTIVNAIRIQAPAMGRFLEQDPVSNNWNDIGDKKAVEKTSQALREGAQNIRKEMEQEKLNKVEAAELAGDLTGPGEQQKPGQILPNGLMVLDDVGIAFAKKKVERKLRIMQDGTTSIDHPKEPSTQQQKKAQQQQPTLHPAQQPAQQQQPVLPMNPMMQAFQKFMGAKSGRQAGTLPPLIQAQQQPTASADLVPSFAQSLNSPQDNHAPPAAAMANQHEKKRSKSPQPQPASHQIPNADGPELPLSQRSGGNASSRTQPQTESFNDVLEQVNNSLRSRLNNITQAQVHVPSPNQQYVSAEGLPPGVSREMALQILLGEKAKKARQAGQSAAEVQLKTLLSLQSQSLATEGGGHLGHRSVPPRHAPSLLGFLARNNTPAALTTLPIVGNFSSMTNEEMLHILKLQSTQTTPAAAASSALPKARVDSFSTTRCNVSTGALAPCVSREMALQILLSEKAKKAQQAKEESVAETQLNALLSLQSLPLATLTDGHLGPTGLPPRSPPSLLECLARHNTSAFPAALPTLGNVSSMSDNAIHGMLHKFKSQLTPPTVASSNSHVPEGLERNPSLGGTPSTDLQTDSFDDLTPLKSRVDIDMLASQCADIILSKSGVQVNGQLHPPPSSNDSSVAPAVAAAQTGITGLPQRSPSSSRECLVRENTSAVLANLPTLGNVSSMSDKAIRQMLHTLKSQSTPLTGASSDSHDPAGPVRNPSLSGILSNSGLLDSLADSLEGLAPLGGQVDIDKLATQCADIILSRSGAQVKGQLHPPPSSNSSPAVSTMAAAQAASVGQSGSLELQHVVHNVIRYLGRPIANPTNLEVTQKMGHTPLPPRASAMLAQMKIAELQRGACGRPPPAVSGGARSISMEDANGRVFHVPPNSAKNNIRDSSFPTTSAPCRGLSSGDELRHSAGSNPSPNQKAVQPMNDNGKPSHDAIDVPAELVNDGSLNSVSSPPSSKTRPSQRRNESFKVLVDAKQQGRKRGSSPPRSKLLLALQVQQRAKDRQGALSKGAGEFGDRGLKPGKNDQSLIDSSDDEDEVVNASATLTAAAASQQSRHRIQHSFEIDDQRRPAKRRAMMSVDLNGKGPSANRSSICGEARLPEPRECGTNGIVNDNALKVTWRDTTRGGNGRGGVGLPRDTRALPDMEMNADEGRRFTMPEVSLAHVKSISESCGILSGGGQFDDASEEEGE